MVIDPVSDMLTRIRMLSHEGIRMFRYLRQNLKLKLQKYLKKKGLFILLI